MNENHESNELPAINQPTTISNIVGYAKSSSSSSDEGFGFEDGKSTRDNPENVTECTIHHVIEDSEAVGEGDRQKETNHQTNRHKENSELGKSADENEMGSVEDNAMQDENMSVDKTKNVEDDLDLPALKRRPKRTIRPVEDKSKVVKFVDSDASSEDDEDKDWDGEGEEGEREAADSNDSDKESSSSNESDDDNSDNQDTDDDEDDSQSDTSNNKELYDTNVEMKSFEEETEENAEPINITKEDMPFLFIPRGAGKRQIKVIQFKNELSEKAKDMSSESSSEDEEWQAKQEDVAEQIAQEEGEEQVDLSNVPMIDEKELSMKKSKPKLPKEPKSKVSTLSHSEALEISICCVCMTGPEEDNILECDNCGITVHEGCYGAPPSDPDNDELDMSWFCEPCIANVDSSQHCELCPNKEGVMKCTDSGKWAHMVCALYSEGIGFGDTSKLEPIITTDIPPSKFGYKKCDLCEDDRFAYSGLVVECDAGLCKSNFHITCAQKLGFLMENSNENEDIKANPFFTHCKIHVDKDLARPKKKAYNLLMEHLKASLNEKMDENASLLLEQKRKEYLVSRRKTVVPAIMTEKHPRALFGSISAFSKLTKKAELFGLNTHVTIVEDADYADRPIKLIKPDISVDFSKQYEARQKQLRETAARSTYHYKNLMNLREEEQKLQAEIHDLQLQVPKLSKRYEKIRKQAVAIWKFLSLVEPTEYDIPDCLMQKQNIRIKAHVIKKKLGLKFCQTCKHAQAPETMVDCDECHNWFHFGCLDPPVTRNPKVSKRWAWFCTECTSSKPNASILNDKENRKSNSTVAKEDKDEKNSEVKSTKYGRSVKKPDHFKCEQGPKEKAQPEKSPDSPKKQTVENVVAIDSFRKSHETRCSMCSNEDCSQKLFCDFCKKHFHLHCTSGTYESGSFVCENCESLTAAVPVLEIKKSEIPPKVSDSDGGKSQKRKNIFELQYDLMQQKKRKEATETKSEQARESDLNISADRSDTTIKQMDTDDEITERDILEEQHSQEDLIASPPPTSKPSLFSNILKGIQQAVAKVPEDSKVKLGMSPVKSVKIVENSPAIENEKVVSVNVEISESDSHQTVLTILPTEISTADSMSSVSFTKPAIISQDPDSDGSLPDVFSD
ncbi:hypothetical protein ACHWQZ_G011660 [Mnemiopsis leidyi]